MNVTVTLAEVTANGVKYDVTFVSNSGDVPLLQIGGTKLALETAERSLLTTTELHGKWC